MSKHRILAIFRISFDTISTLDIWVKTLCNASGMMYKIRLKQGELSNRIVRWLGGGRKEVNSAWNELIGLQYRQGIRSIPINAIISNSIVLSILFVVIFLHWKEGAGYAADTSGYQQILTAIMIMNYAVSAGHSLYGRIVGWQMALPSLYRLTDFLTVDRLPTSSEITPPDSVIHQGVSG